MRRGQGLSGPHPHRRNANVTAPPAGSTPAGGAVPTTGTSDLRIRRAIQTASHTGGGRRLAQVLAGGTRLVERMYPPGGVLTVDRFGPGAHAVLMRQVYNKTRAYLEWLAGRLGAQVTIVDDGDRVALEAAISPRTAFVFAETFTNPLVRAQDLDMLRDVVAAARGQSPGVRLIVDSTIATPWAFPTPLLAQGVDVVEHASDRLCD